jgi:hypothetical protein
MLPVMRALVLCLLAACSAPARTTSAPVASPDSDAHDLSPRLVVLLVIDQWPEWAFKAKRPALTRGFARLLAEGEWRTGRIPSIATLTAPGHALLGTGESPARSGIVANEWWSRDETRVVRASEASGVAAAVWPHAARRPDRTERRHGADRRRAASHQVAHLDPVADHRPRARQISCGIGRRGARK